MEGQRSLRRQNGKAIDYEERLLNSVSFRFLALVYAFLHRLWLALNYTLSWPFPNESHRHATFNNKLLVLGDDFAFGTGDYTTLGGKSGLTQYLPNALLKEGGLKQNWAVYNCGVFGSTTRDWLPRSGIPSPGTETKTTYLSRVLDRTMYADASVIVILLGFNDGAYGIPIQESITNVQSMCQVLANMGKQVWVCPVANWGDDGDRDEARRERNSAFNDQLDDFLAGDHRPQQVHPGPRIDASNFEYRNEGLYAMNGRHFSSKGYKKFAADFAEILIKDLVKIEFKKFKGALGYS